MIDKSKVLHLFDGDEFLMEKFIMAFRMKMSGMLASITNYLDEGNRELLSNTMHVIKTQSAYMGLDQITELAGQIEAQIDDNTPLEELQEAIHQLIASLEKAIIF